MILPTQITRKYINVLRKKINQLNIFSSRYRQKIFLLESWTDIIIWITFNIHFLSLILYSMQTHIQYRDRWDDNIAAFCIKNKIWNQCCICACYKIDLQTTHIYFIDENDEDDNDIVVRTNNKLRIVFNWLWQMNENLIFRIKIIFLHTFFSN